MENTIFENSHTYVSIQPEHEFYFGPEWLTVLDGPLVQNET